MRVLLDSHTLVWFLNGDARCSIAAREAIEAADAEAVVSAASAWEVATKVRMGRWAEAGTVARDFETILADNGFSPLGISVGHARLAGSLPSPHRDPFDRMLAAQAIVENMPLITADPAFGGFDVAVIW